MNFMDLELFKTIVDKDKNIIGKLLHKNVDNFKNPLLISFNKFLQTIFSIFENYIISGFDFNENKMHLEIYNIIILDVLILNNIQLKCVISGGHIVQPNGDCRLSVNGQFFNINLPDSIIINNTPEKMILDFFEYITSPYLTLRKRFDYGNI